MPARRYSARSAVACLATTAVIAGYATPLAFADTPPPDTAAAAGLRAALTGPGGAAAFIDGLAPVGSFSDAAPGLTVIPGAKDALGIDDVVQKAIDAYPAVATADSPAAIAAALTSGPADIASDAGTKRHVSWQADVGGTDPVSRLGLTLTVTRDVPSGLHVHSNDVTFDFTTASGLLAKTTMVVRLAVDFDKNAGTAWLEPAGTGATVDITADPDDASGPNALAKAKAAIGILGVTLADGSTYHDVAHLAASFRDPNNDNKLTLGSTGELGAKDASSGISTVSLVKNAGGTLDGSLVIKPKASSAISGLPDNVNATVGLHDGDWSAGGPTATVTAGSLDSVLPFETLSTYDLAQGVAQLSATIKEIQSATPASGAPINQPLPFLHGTTADLVPATEALDRFLAVDVPPSTAADKLGQPKFASIQDMFDDLQATSGPKGDPGRYTVSLASSGFNADPTRPTLPFTITVDRAPSKQSADPIADLVSAGPAGVSYTDTSITDSSPSARWSSLEDPQAFANGLVGRQVSVGASSALIGPGKPSLTIDGTGKVTSITYPLDAADAGLPGPSAWKGGTPTAGAYVISGGDPQTGLVQLADLLREAGGLRSANATRPQAVVDAGYHLRVPILLDLEPAVTGTDCAAAGKAGQVCPFTVTPKDKTGLSYVVEEWPVRSDRFRLVTGDSHPLLTSKSTLSTPVDLVAPVGYVPVHVTGTIDVCPQDGYDAACAASGSPGTLTSLSLLTPSSAGSHPDVSLTTAFAAARDDAHSLIDGTYAAHAHADLHFDVVNDPHFFGATPGHTTLDADTGATAGAPTGTDLASLKPLDVKPGTDNALYGVLLADLSAINTTLHTPLSDTGLSTPIPLVGSSLGALIAGDQRVTGASYDVVDKDGKPAFLSTTGRTFTKADIGRPVRIGSETLVVADATDTGAGLLAPVPATKPADGTPYTIGDGLEQSVGTLTALPPADMAALLAQVDTALGGSPTAAAPPVTFTVTPGATSTDAAVLHLSLDWSRGFTTQVPTALHLRLPQADFAGDAGAGGSIPVHVDSHEKLHVAIPLDAAGVANPAAKLAVDRDSSSRDATVTLPGAPSSYHGAVGPLAVSIGGATVAGSLQTTVKDTTGSASESLTDWTKNLKAASFGGGTPATCAGVTSSVPLALCASLPMTFAGANETLVLRLPQSDAGGYAASLDPTKTLTGSEQRESDLPTLKAKLDAAKFDPAPLGQGLLGFIDDAKSGLGVATADGKVPLIGSDLQAGKDFLGALRSNLAGAFDPTKLGSFATYGQLKATVQSALSNAGADLQTTAPDVTGTCAVTITAPGTPTVNATDPNDDKEVRSTYDYRVVGVANDGQQTVASGTGSASNRSVLGTPSGGTHAENGVSWSAAQPAQHVASYSVYRRITPSGGAAGPWQLVQSGIHGTSFTDTGQSGTDAATVGNDHDPKVTEDCQSNDDTTTVQTLSVHVQYGKGDHINPDAGCRTDSGADAAHTCYQAAIPLDLGLPGLSLRALSDPSGAVHKDVTATLGWKLDLSATLDKSKGLLLDTKNAGNHLRVGAAISVPSMDANLSFLHVGLTNQKSDDTVMHAQFSVNLTCNGGCTDGQRPLADVVSNPGGSFDALIGGGFDVDELIKTDVDPSLPGISTDFKFAAGWPTDTAHPDGVSPLAFTVQTLEFDDVSIDVGTFLGKTIYPIVQDVVNTLKPVQPILDTITAPIPVLSDLSHLVGGDDVTIASLAADFGYGSPDVNKVLAVVKNITDMAKHLQGGSGGGFLLGSFSLLGDKVKDTEATPASAGSLIGSVDSGASMPTGTADGKVGDLLGKLNGSYTHDSSTALSGTSSGAGISFPALSDPTQLFALLAGGDATLAKFDSGALSLGFSFSQAFGPVYAPPPVMIVISGSASVTLHVVAGFDTYGIRQAVETGKPVQVLNSLYFQTTDDSGAPIPVVSFHGELAAGAEVSVAFLSVGVEGGIGLTVNFTWADPNNDGKFRFDEFLAAALRNPICLFNVGGDLSIFLKVFVTIGFSPFDVSFDFTLVNIKLLDFSVKPNCEPAPPKLAGENDDKVLYLFAGRLGNAPRGDSAWWATQDGKSADETWVVHQQDDGSYMVKALGFEQVFPGDVKSIVLDGRGYAGSLNVLFQPGKDNGADRPFGADVYVYGGNQNDTIKVPGSRAWIDGGGGDDTITTGDRANALAGPAVAGGTGDNPPPYDLVAGGDGSDHLNVGNNVDTVLGDGALGQPSTSASLTLHTYGVEHPKKDGESQQLPYSPDEATDVSVDAGSVGGLLTPGGIGVANQDSPDGKPGQDVVQVGLGGSTVRGGGDNDTIAVAEDSPLADIPANHDKRTQLVDAGTVIYGDDGSDNISGGSGDDTIYTGTNPPAAGPLPVEDNPGSDDKAGSDGKPTTNHVDTGTGNDKVFGSTAVDFVIGHSKDSEHDEIYGAGNTDVLIGGLGSDKVYGGRGDDYLSADAADVAVVNGAVSDQVGPETYVLTHKAGQPTSTTPKLLVGGGGTDRIYGGNGRTDIYGDHSTYLDHGAYLADPCAGTGPDPSDPPAEHPRDAANPPADGSTADYDGPDVIHGGNGPDVIQAGGGADWAYAGDGANLVCGEGGADHLYGGNDVDTVFGGSDGDVVQGFGGADALFGNTGGDFVYGNAGNDLIEGNADDDVLFGGEDDDRVVGGTTTPGRADGQDVLYGDTGRDSLIGDNGDATDVTAGPVYDLALAGTPAGGLDGAHDVLYGGDDADRLYGGLANDYVDGGRDADHAEGNPGDDTILGQNGADDLIGGSVQLPGGVPTAKDAQGYSDTHDTITGGDGDDVIVGDNGQVSDTGGGDSGDTETVNRGLTVGRHVVLYDLGYADDPSRYGGDDISGGNGPDVAFGQGGVDTMHGDAGDDYLEGDQGGDQLFGDGGQDDIAGGSRYAESGTGQATAGQLDAGDTISGGADADVVLGDNGLVTRDPAVPTSAITRGRSDTDATPATPMALRGIQPFDLGDHPTAGTSGGDFVTGDGGSDVVLAQSGNDRVLGNADGDYVEGGPDRDWVEGNAGDDDLLGGSATILGADPGNDTAQGQPDSGDAVFGGTGDDLITGDNAVTDRASTPSRYLFRIGSVGTLETQRSLRLLDLRWGSDLLADPKRAVSGGDQLAGGAGVDVIFGQDGADLISGGAGDDYAEGNGGRDTIYGDRTFTELGVVPAAPTPAWPGAASGEADISAPAGQDDLIGGSSIQAFRDTTDEVHGDGAADFVLGDNGNAVRDILDASGAPVTTVAAAAGRPLPLVDRIYAKRYDPAHVPADAAYVRHGTTSTSPTRFCVGSGSTCEPAGAFGADLLWGDGGSDTVYGQDGDDHLYGDTGALARPDATSPAVVDDQGGVTPAQANDDDLYGELGDDVMWGEYGDDAMLGDRGGIVDTFQNGSNHFTVDNSQVPKIHYDGFLAGSVTRVVDLQHDVNGDAFLGSSTSAVMPHRGDLEGGNDRMRGGVGHDSMHGGFGTDLMNGDSGGDVLFGDDGADVMWGGKGSDDPNNPNDRGTNDALVDYLFGGKGGTDAASKAGASGADILDWHPRGNYSATSTYCTPNAWPVDVTAGPKTVATTLDPCSWYQMTDTDNASVDDNQHHQGIDWMYGGWDRDVLQGDVADNGPNLGDRLLDWNGAFNLYTHCNAAYGGYNDVRQHSPAMQDFLQRWAYGVGAGQTAADDVSGSTSSAFDELALAYPGTDNTHASGSDFPSTPGHFDNPNACSP